MSGEIAGAGGASAECDDLDRARCGAAQVFARLVWLYTAGESTSIGEGEAEQLLGSMTYVLGVRSLDEPAAVAVLACDDPLGAFERHRAALERRSAATVDAWREVAATTRTSRRRTCRRNSCSSHIALTGAGFSASMLLRRGSMPRGMRRSGLRTSRPTIWRACWMPMSLATWILLPACAI